MQRTLGEIVSRLTRIENRLGGVENQLGRVEDRLGGVEDRLGGVEDRLGDVEDRLGGVEDRLGGLEDRQLWVNAVPGGFEGALSEPAREVWGGFHRFDPMMGPGDILQGSVRGGSRRKYVFMGVWALMFFALSRYLGNMDSFEPIPYARACGSSGISKTTSLIYVILRILHGAFEKLKTVIVREAAPGAVGATSGMSVYHRMDDGIFIGSAPLCDISTRGNLPFVIHGFKTRLGSPRSCATASLRVDWGSSVLWIGDAPNMPLVNPGCWVLAANSVGSLLQPFLACEVPLRLWLPSRKEVMKAMELSGVAEEARREARFELVGGNLALACGQSTEEELLEKVEETVSRLLNAQGAAETPHTREVGTRLNHLEELGGELVLAWGSAEVCTRFREASVTLARRATSSFFAAWNDRVLIGLLHQEKYLQVLRVTFNLSGTPRFFERIKGSARFEFVKQESAALAEVRREMLTNFGGTCEFDEEERLRSVDWEPERGKMYVCGGDFPLVDAFLRTERLLIGVNATVGKEHKTSVEWLELFVALARRLGLILVLFFVTDVAHDDPVKPKGIRIETWVRLEAELGADCLLFAQADVDSAKAFNVPQSGKADEGFAAAVRTIVDGSGRGRQGSVEYDWCGEFDQFEFWPLSREVPFPFALCGRRVVFSPALSWPRVTEQRERKRTWTGLRVGRRKGETTEKWKIVGDEGLRDYGWKAVECVEESGELWVCVEQLSPSGASQWKGFQRGLVQVSYGDGREQEAAE